MAFVYASLYQQQLQACTSFPGSHVCHSNNVHNKCRFLFTGRRHAFTTYSPISFIVPSFSPPSTVDCNRGVNMNYSVEEIENAKVRLLEMIEPLDCGAKALDQDNIQKSVRDYVEFIETMNKSTDPLNDPDLSGSWRLIYTDSKEILGVLRPKLFQPALSQIYQDVNATNQTIVNREIIAPFGFTITNTVQASFTTKLPNRLMVKFEKFQIGGFLSFKAGERFRGWLDITYLDWTMRISRGNKGNIFVLVKDDVPF